MPDRIVITDQRLPDDRFIMDGIDDTQGPKGAIPAPVFNVSQVAKIFFARSPHWLRWRERRGAFTLDGRNVGGSREDPDAARQYTLSDVERMVHALMSNDLIDIAQMKNALLAVQAIANVWGLLDQKESSGE